MLCESRKKLIICYIKIEDSYRIFCVRHFHLRSVTCLLNQLTNIVNDYDHTDYKRAIEENVQKVLTVICKNKNAIELDSFSKQDVLITRIVAI